MNDTSTTSSLATSPRFRGEMLNHIYRVWLFRRLLPVLALEVAILSLLFYGIAKLVFVERVVDNALEILFRNPSGIFSFAVAAFLHAPIATKLITAGSIVVIALLIRLLTQGILRWILVKENYFSRISK